MQIYGATSAHGPHSVNRAHLEQAQAPQGTNTLEQPSDEVEISEMAQVLESMATSSDVRQDRIDAIRQQIADGIYETDEKLNGAIERLLDDIA